MSVATMSPAANATSAVRPLAAQPYLSFEGRCEEALNFYREVLGAEVTMMLRFADAPKDAGPGCDGMVAPPADKIMHASFKLGSSELHATDGMCQAHGAQFKGISLSIPFSTIPAAEHAFSRLSEGGHVHMAFAETFFAKRFGMVADRFGVVWMVIVPKPM